MNFICLKYGLKSIQKDGYCDKLMKAAYFVNLMQDKISLESFQQETRKCKKKLLALS